MSKATDRVKKGGAEGGGWLKEKAIPLLTLLLVIAITAVLFLFAQRYPERVAEFENYGYLGAFLISLVSNATIIVPMPAMLLLFAIGAVLNPILVGLIGAGAGAIGELTSYVAGYSGRAVALNTRWYTRAERWMRRWGTMTIFVFSLVPLLPFDIAGMVAGVLRFSLWKFWLACFLGKALLYTGMALAGAWGWEVVLRYFG